MTHSKRIVFTATASLVAWAFLAKESPAQLNFRIPTAPPTSVDVRLMQAARRTAIVGAALGSYYRSIPPYAIVNPAPPIPFAAGAAPVFTGGLGPSPLLGAAALGTNPYLGGSAATLSTDPLAAGAYGGGLASPYYPPFDPFGGPLRGAADVTMANANYQVTLQEARLKREESIQARMDTRRAIIKEALWERQFRPDAEKNRLEEMQSRLDRARHDPPRSEVWSGQALNELLRHLINRQSKGAVGSTVPLDKDTLRNINVSSGVGGNVGLLKDGGELHWPISLQGPDYKELRDKLDRGLPDAVNMLKFNNPVDKSAIDDMTNELRAAHDRLDANVSNTLPSDFIEAKRYLNQLSNALRALRDQNAANYFTQKWVAKGSNVAELVKHMTDSGLTFAPAVSGDEAAYNALHHAMVAYDASLPADNTSTAQTQTTPPPSNRDPSNRGNPSEVDE